MIKLIIAWVFLDYWNTCDIMIGDAGINSHTFIVALDVGTTNVRCLVINASGLIVGKSHQKVKQIHCLSSIIY